MIQRIQSLFLFLAAASAFALFAIPFASVAEPMATVESSIFADGYYNILDHIGTIVLFGLAGALVLVSIFLFNKRSLQMSLVRFAIISNIIGFILAIVLFFNEKDGMGDAVPQDNIIGISLPILFIVFSLLALRFIGKDEKLVKSMDRLR